MQKLDHKKTKKNIFLPYRGKTKKIYFIYAGLFAFFGLLILISNLFLIINLSINNHFKIINHSNDSINLVVTPVLNIILVLVSWILLVFAPQRIHHSPKQSSVMFYFSFWTLAIATLLNCQIQLTYNSLYWNSSFYHWIDNGLLVILIVLITLILFFIEIFFWIMRRKFAFMPTDYEIYTTRSKNKKIKKQIKKQAKQIKKQEKKTQKMQVKGNQKIKKDDTLKVAVKLS